MNRRLVSNLVSALSLVLCLGSVVLWVRGHRWLDEFAVERVDAVPTADGRHVVVHSGVWEVGSTKGTIYAAAELERIVYTPEDVRDDIILADWRKREGVHLRHWEQGAVPFRNMYSSDTRNLLAFYCSGYGNPSFRWPPSDDSGRAVGAPAWLLAAVFAVLPMWKITRSRRCAREGCCATCGYDLTGNISGVCPECGTAVAARAIKPPK